MRVRNAPKMPMGFPPRALSDARIQISEMPNILDVLPSVKLPVASVFAGKARSGLHGLGGLPEDDPRKLDFIKTGDGSTEVTTASLRRYLAHVAALPVMKLAPIRRTLKGKAADQKPFDEEGVQSTA
jgi:hypothetical protein